LECQVFESVNSDACPRPTTGSCNCASWDAAHPDAQTAESPFNADRFEIAKVRKTPCRPRSWANFSLS
jgi:hypothetical protein